MSKTSRMFRVVQKRMHLHDARPALTAASGSLVGFLSRGTTKVGDGWRWVAARSSRAADLEVRDDVVVERDAAHRLPWGAGPGAARAARWSKQAVTFGTAGRVGKAWDEYGGVVREARALAIQVEERRLAANAFLEELVRVKIASLPSLSKIHEIARNLNARERVFAPEIAEERTPEVALARVDRTLLGGVAAFNAAKGVNAGVSTALGAWALAQVAATASTGTAISSLSGAAATSATLAWFGGGSLAAGGLGVAGGTMVLGGIVAVPTLAIMAMLARAQANRKIAEIEKESADLEDVMDEMRKLELVATLAEQRATELISVIGKARQAYEHEYQGTYCRLFPLRWLSRARRRLRKWLWERTGARIGGPYFRQEEVEDIGRLLEVAAEFAGILDQQVFGDNGSVREGAT